MSELLIEQIKKETDPFVKSKLIIKLVKEEDWPVKKVAEKLNCQPAYISHFLRLKKLPEIVIDGYYNKDITLSHLFVLSRLRDEKEIISAYEKVLAEGLTVMKTEELVREMLYRIKTEGESLSEKEKADYLAKLPKDFEIKVIQTRIKSRIIFEIKGSLRKTTAALRELLNRLTKF